MILRTMKAERTADWFADPVWDEAHLLKLPQEILELLMGYILRAVVDKKRFERKVKSILEMDLRTKAMTIADQLRAEGSQDALAKAVLTALEVRFGNVPGEMTLAIKRIDEVAKLERLLRAALQAPTLDGFRLGM